MRFTSSTTTAPRRHDPQRGEPGRGEAATRAGFEFGLSPFYFFRHGEPHESNFGVLQSQAQAELTREGQRYAAEVARRFDRLEFESVYSSPLARALASAAIIAEMVRAPVNRLPDLRDRRWGYARPLTAPQSTSFVVPEKIEPIEDFSARVILSLRTITGPEPVLIVAHSGIFRVIINHARHPKVKLAAAASPQLFYVEPAVTDRGHWRVAELPI